MKAMKMWAAGVGSSIGAFILQWVTSPSATDAINAAAQTAGSWVQIAIVTLGTAVSAMIVTYFSPKNAE